MQFKEKTLKKASRFARANANTIRRMLLLAAMVYGKKATEQQFLLRKITTLSLYLFGILAVLARLASEEKAGPLKKKDLLLLQYFLEEAKEARRKNRRLFDSRKERLSMAIPQSLQER